MLRIIIIVINDNINNKPGQQFDGQIIPSATVLIVGVGRTEAKVEGLFSEVCRLGYKGNVLDSMGGQVLKGGWVHQPFLRQGVVSATVDAKTE